MKREFIRVCCTQLKLLNATKYNVESWIRHKNNVYKHKILWNMNKTCVLVSNAATFVNFQFIYNIGSAQPLRCPTLCEPMGFVNTRLPCPSPTPRACSNSCPLSRWCHPTISSSVVHFSSRFQSFPALGSFPMSQLFTSGGQSIGASVSASVLPMNIQDWFPLG